ncbi:hypothetical protein RLDS_07845 [Sphingobium lactosutens DS20]|jgi:hypothetical protein|uniref:Uncharacterized protein n=1 Tax=Sphingobium lactosutens DS20 TaxID=1331060 RepID=T0J367_9SPHN|nr:hypothetical protein SKA58_06585 [Sphingomonas sp. SKA58]EQB16384.1 hypothetical protein RLDS_07845 [Sphingobium lactosutens DS20]
MRDPDKPDLGFLWFSLLLTAIGLLLMLFYG